MKFIAATIIGAALLFFGIGWFAHSFLTPPPTPAQVCVMTEDEVLTWEDIVVEDCHEKSVPWHKGRLR